jgi:hypothetical protein
MAKARGKNMIVGSYDTSFRYDLVNVPFLERQLPYIGSNGEDVTFWFKMFPHKMNELFKIESFSSLVKVYYVRSSTDLMINIKTSLNWKRTQS